MYRETQYSTVSKQHAASFEHHNYEFNLARENMSCWSASIGSLAL